MALHYSLIDYVWLFYAFYTFNFQILFLVCMKTEGKKWEKNVIIIIIIIIMAKLALLW